MTIFCALLLAHLLYDFHWQGPFISEMKSKSWFILGVHALTWALLLCAVLWWFGALAWWHLPYLTVTHFACDAWKSRQPKTPATWHYIYYDQAFHLVTMIAVVL